MDSQSVSGCAISMDRVQFQSKLSMPKIFQRFGIETVCVANQDRALREQNFSWSYCGKMESSFVLDNFHCRSCRHLISLILGALIKSIKLSLNIGYLISQAMAGLPAPVLKRQLDRLSRSLAFSIQIHTYYG
jgi:hypothetical protein